MKITAKMREWIIENCDVKEDATDDDLRKAVAEALVNERLSAEKYGELATDPEAGKADEFTSKLDAIADSLAKVATLLQPKEEEKKDDPPEEEAKKDTKSAPKEGSDEWKKSVESNLRNSGTGDVRVKRAHEVYSTTKSALMYPKTTKSGQAHPYAGMRASDFGRPLDESSERDRALAGVWAKFQIMSKEPKLAGSPDRAWEKLSDHEKDLMEYLINDTEWDCSDDNHLKTRKGYEGGKQALIDEAVGGGLSGGLEAAPIVFDDNVIQAPLLHGELFPLVNTIPLARGRRIEGVATGTVTSTWGGVDDTAVGLFNTAGYVSAFDTTVFRWEGSIRIGLDFMSDTPIDFQSHVVAQYGQRLLEDMDDVIATGNGTTQPEGIINHAGVGVNAWLGVTTLGNYEALRYGIPKQEHGPTVRSSAIFCGTETSFARAKAIPVAAADARRVFAYESTTSGTYDDYSIMQRAYKINESLTNEQIFYAIMARYRMYRRKGFTVRTSMEGDTLIRRNELLIVVMSRYGGQLERAACAVMTADAPA